MKDEEKSKEQLLRELQTLRKKVADISHTENELQKVKDLLNRTNRVARIGGWEVDLIANQVQWTDITREIHEVASDFIPDIATAINFYKEGESRETIQALVADAIESGKAYNVELQIITAKGNELWVRAIGQAEFEGSKAVRLYGTFQDIDLEKKYRLLDRQRMEDKQIQNHLTYLQLLF